MFSIYFPLPVSVVPIESLCFDVIIKTLLMESEGLLCLLDLQFKTMFQFIVNFTLNLFSEEIGRPFSFIESQDLNGF